MDRCGGGVHKRCNKDICCKECESKCNVVCYNVSSKRFDEKGCCRLIVENKDVN